LVHVLYTRGELNRCKGFALCVSKSLDDKYVLHEFFAHQSVGYRCRVFCMRIDL